MSTVETLDDWSRIMRYGPGGPLLGGPSQAHGCWRLGPKRQAVESLGYWSGMRRVKNSTSSDAAGGSRLLRLTTT